MWRLFVRCPRYYAGVFFNLRTALFTGLPRLSCHDSGKTGHNTRNGGLFLVGWTEQVHDCVSHIV